MSLLAYSTCRINYTLNNTENPEREYSDRSVVELRLDDNQNVSLRAVDVEPTKIVRQKNKNSLIDYIQSFSFRKFSIFLSKVVVNISLDHRKINVI
jgi:hypothetical protein